MTEPACLSIVDRRAWLTWVEASVLVDRESARGAWVVTFSYSSRTATLGTTVLTCFHVLEGGGGGCAGDAEMWKAAMATVRMSLSGSWSPPEVLSSCECSHSTTAKEDSSKGRTPAKEDFERVLPAFTSILSKYQ